MSVDHVRDLKTMDDGSDSENVGRAMMFLGKANWGI